MPGYIRCAICGENLGREDSNDFMRHVELGDIAEMYDPEVGTASGIVHVTCGQAENWEVS
jgi:hypothetical protein